MTKLSDFEAEKRILSADELLTEIEAEEAEGGNGQMRAGWMWFDNDPKRSIEEKIQQAIQRYHAKFGRFPNSCYVNQRSITGDDFRCGEVRVVAAPNILPHHFWLGPLEKAA